MWNLTKGLLIITLVVFSVSIKAQVGINKDNPNPAAILDIESDTLGVLFPRIADSSFLDNEEGLFFYATNDHKFYFYNGSSWQCVNPLMSTGPSNARLNGSLEVQGNVTVEAESTISGYGTIPLGGIIMWSGVHTNVPDGWALCNGDLIGTIQTPDLRGRFVVGWSDGNKTSSDPRYDGYGDKNSAVSLAYQYVGDIGGDTTVILSEAQMPTHNHNKGTLNITASGSHNHGYRKPGLGSDKVEFDAVGAGSGESIYHIGATSESSTHTHPNSSFSGNTGNKGGVYHPEEYYYDYSGSECQYNTAKPGCTDLSPYKSPYNAIKADPCDGSFDPVDPVDPGDPALAASVDPGGTTVLAAPGGPGDTPEFNLNCFLNKPMCKNNDYNPGYGQKKVTKAAYYSQDPVENRPPYYVVAFIIRVK